MMRCSTAAIAVGLTGLGLLVGSSGASAATFTVPNYGTYDITTLNTSYNSSTALLQSQPWWGSITAAEAFTTTVGSSLGAVNNGGNFGPLFAYSLDLANGGAGTIIYSFINGAIITNAFASPSTTFAYAVATPVTSTVPEPSEILGTLLFSALSAGYLVQRHNRKVA